MASDSPLDRAPLDAYSQVVAGVAAELTPRVASLRVRHDSVRGRAEGLGSAVIYTPDGFLLTNAHVVGRADRGTALFADGRNAEFRVVGADPLSDLAVVRADSPTPDTATLGEADSLVVGQLVVAVGSPLGLTGSVTDRRGAEPWQLRRGARRRRGADRRHQHRRCRSRAGPGGTDQRHHPEDHCRADARRQGSPGLPGHRQFPCAAA